MKKILYITNISNGVSSFSIAAVKAAKKEGLDFHLAGNFGGTPIEKLRQDEKKYGIRIHQIDLSRSPYAKTNLIAYKQLVKLIRNEKIDYIHCNTPVGGLLGRLTGEKCNVQKIIYQVHGFHFFDGAPVKNWLIYYPIEKWLARKTNAIITINNEDFEHAKKFKLKGSGHVYYVPGVGMDLSQYNLPENTRENKRSELKIKDTDIVMISMGDLIDRKNYPIAIRAVAKVNNPNIHYFICGKGPEEKKLKKLAVKLNIVEQIHFLGYRTDIKELLKAADIFIFTSKQEGLARSLMEAMACGLPCVVSNIRGNKELICDSEGGNLCSNTDEYVKAINNYIYDENRRRQSSLYNEEHIKSFDIKSVINILGNIYKAEFTG